MPVAAPCGGDKSSRETRIGVTETHTARVFAHAKPMTGTESGSPTSETAIGVLSFSSCMSASADISCAFRSMNSSAAFFLSAKSTFASPMGGCKLPALAAPRSFLITLTAVVRASSGHRGSFFSCTSPFAVKATASRYGRRVRKNNIDTSSTEAVAARRFSASEITWSSSSSRLGGGGSGSRRVAKAIRALL